MDYKTILLSGTSEWTVEKSKFIGYAKPVKNENDAVQFIDRIKKEHYRANHTIPIYIIGSKMEVQRYSDDGEPSGTAGLPVIEMLKKEGITDICLVITRYFGGIKLGTGGLVRAYTQSAKNTIGNCRVVEMKTYNHITFRINYDMQGKIEYFLRNYEPVLISEVIYLDQVTYRLFVKPEFYNEFKYEIKEISADKISIEEIERLSLAFDNDIWIKNAKSL